MKHPETQMVTPANGPRPAGSPNKCFYCPSLVGQPHADDCVCRLRTVVMRAVITYATTVPEGWTEEDILQHRNESSWCADNVLPEIERAQQVNGCLCKITEFEFVREATAEDERRNGIHPIFDMEKM